MSTVGKSGFITAMYIILVPIIGGIIAAVWFITGGIIDLRKLFKALSDRVVDPLDNGQVKGNVSLSDIAIFEKREEAEEKAGEKEKK